MRVHTHKKNPRQVGFGGEKRKNPNATRRKDEGEQKVNIGREIELFLRRTGMRPARFGRLAARDPKLVFDVRAGREMRATLIRRLRDFIATQDAEKEARP
jgi:hypothetical protein